MLLVHLGKLIAVVLFSFSQTVSVAHAQDQSKEVCEDCYDADINEDFGDIFEELSEIMKEVDDRSVLSSTDSETNPKVAELCRYIENGKSALMPDVLGNNEHSFFEKREVGQYYSSVDWFSEFSCREKFSGNLKSTSNISRYSPLELSVLNSRGGGIVVFKQLLGKIRSLRPEDQLTIINKRNEVGHDLSSFIDDVRVNYIRRTIESGMHLKPNDSIILLLKSMEAEVENLTTDALEKQEACRKATETLAKENLGGVFKESFRTFCGN